jgi:phospholipase D1/2
VSPLSFVHGLGMSTKEGAGAKRSNDDFRGRSIFVRVPFMCDKCKFHHGEKWFVLKDSYLVYMNPNSALIGFPMLIDKAFSLEQGFRKTGTNNGIRIKNLQRSMIIKFEKDDERDVWFNALMNVKNKCLLSEQHSFNSYAPKRQQQYAQWLVIYFLSHLEFGFFLQNLNWRRIKLFLILNRFVNGQSYMEAVAKAILAAREEIFITDWWLSPELTLIRPCDDDSMRLDNLLGKRAVSFQDFLLLYNIFENIGRRNSCLCNGI